MTDKNIDQAKEGVKEAAGALTGDQRLTSEGTPARRRKPECGGPKRPRCASLMRLRARSDFTGRQASEHRGRAAVDRQLGQLERQVSRP